MLPRANVEDGNGAFARAHADDMVRLWERSLCVGVRDCGMGTRPTRHLRRSCLVCSEPQLHFTLGYFRG